MPEKIGQITEYHRGDRLRAETVNAILRELKLEAFNKYGADDISSYRKYSEDDLIPYINSSGATIPEGAILVGATDATDIHLQLTATKPATTWQWVWYVNSMRKVTNGKRGLCSLAGERTLIQTTGTITPGMFVGPQSDSFVGIGNRNGFMCVGKSRTINSVQYTPCIQNYPRDFYGKPTGTFALNAANGVITLWDAAFAASILFTLSDVNIRTRAMTATTRVSGNVVGGEVNAYPIDCTDS